MAESAAVARALAVAFLAGPWGKRELLASGAQVLGSSPEWLARLVHQILRRFRAPPTDDLFALRELIEASRSFRSAFTYRVQTPRVAAVFAGPPSMAQSPWSVPELCTTQDLARWCGWSDTELDWFADWKGLNRARAGHSLQHYSYRWLPKRRGGYRLLEAPKPRLKRLQRRLLRELLERVPTHEAAHGFVRGRSALSLAHAHSGKLVLLRLDLEEFFASIGAPRVRRVFRGLGYPDEVARSLAGLCTTITPAAVRHALPGPGFTEFRDAHALAARERLKKRLTARHLAQGAPCSPALANLAAFQLDVRLAHAARSVGALYGRYADDLVFSGDLEFARRVARFEPLVGAIALDEGFRVNHRKTRVMRRGTQQRMLGLITNARPAVSRAERDQLEAILTNAVRHGLASQNRAQHPNFLEYLRGRVRWVEQACPEHAPKLRRLLSLCEFG
ncbi:MAG TPA: reverse transcriptase family protein [Polyangiaceae bacterium]|jgi:hypothetical protein